MFERGHYCDVRLSLQPWTSQQAGGQAGSNPERLPGSCSWTCKSQTPPPQLTVCVWWWSVGWNRAFPQWRGLLALQASDSAAKSRTKACPLPDVHFTAPQQPAWASLLLPPLPFEMGSHQWDVKGTQAEELLAGSCIPWCWSSRVEPCPVLLCLCPAMSCQGASPSPGSAMASGHPPAIFGNITPWIANFCAWWESLGSLVS